MPVQIPVYKPGENIPGKASADVVGGHLVSPTGPADATTGAYPCAHTGAAAWALGVAERDALGTVTNGAEWRGMFNIVGPGSVARVVAGAAVAVTSAAIAVKSDSTGRVIAQGGSGVIVGYALTAAAAAGDIIEVKLI